MLNESIPTASARTASSTVLRTTTSPLSGCPDSSTVTKMGVSNPNSISWSFIASSSLRDGPAVGGQGQRDAGGCGGHGSHHPLTRTDREGRADPGTGRARVIHRLLGHDGGVTTVAEFLRAHRDQLQ